jgi:hypothetical protein
LLAEQKLALIEQRIHDLAHMRRLLTSLIAFVSDYRNLVGWSLGCRLDVLRWRRVSRHIDRIHRHPQERNVIPREKR